MKSIIQSEFDFNSIPYGYCQCGCGQLTTIPTRTKRAINRIAGQPMRFRSGHATKLRGRPIPERFWEKVEKSGNPGDCWCWLGKPDEFGYGKFTMKLNGRRCNIMAHRVSYELTYGPIPEGLEVCHRCDNPPCVNPSHLFVGTHMDNMLDRDAKGRCPRKRTDLTSEQVAQMRKQRVNGLTFRAIGLPHNLSEGTVRDIIKGRYGWDKF